MAPKDLGQVFLDILLPIDRTSVEPHHVAVPAEAPGELTRVSLVPAAQKVLVQVASGALSSGRLSKRLIRHGPPTRSQG
jgi:hypothetical protein